jgi:3-oxoacyl-[acyl-carrier-protein] synthase II
MTAERRVVVTGIGMVTPLGPDLERTWQALESGQSGLGPVSRFDASGFAEKTGGEVRDFDPRPHFRVPKALKLTDHRTKLAVAAASMALDDAGFVDREFDRGRLGVLVGSSGSDLQTEDLARALRGDADMACATNIRAFAERILTGLNPLWLLVNLPNMISAHVAIQLESNGPNSTVMTDWVAGSQAIGEAMGWIAEGEADAVLAGGADTGLTPFVFSAYQVEGLFCLQDEALPSRFVVAEGAAMLVLEEREHARRRSARVYGDLKSYATASFPLDEQNCAVEETMSVAVEQAGWDKCEIEALCSASVFAAPYWRAERRAVHRLFGSSRSAGPRLLEFKSRMGHTLAASGAIEVALTLKSLAGSRTRGAALCNALGFSGQAATLAVCRGEAA